MNKPSGFWQLDAGTAQNIALIDTATGPKTYADLRADVARAAALLEHHATLLGTNRLLIAIELSAQSPIIALYLAALSAGHVLLVAAPGTFNTANSTAGIYAPNLIAHMSGDRCVTTPAALSPANLHPDLRLLLSTSGSTGDPKLVRLSAENLSSNAAAIADYLCLRPDDRAVTTLPLHYIYGLSVLHAHLHAGAGVVLTDLSVTDASFSPLFAQWHGTNISVVPHQVDLLLASGFQPRTLQGLRHIAQAGGKLAPDKVRVMARLAQQGGWSFFVMYGQTEASPRMAYLPPQMAEAHPDCVGRAIPGGSFTLQGTDALPITRAGVAGDLMYSGPNVMMGYAKSRSDLAHPKDTFQLATGDVAEYTPEGLIKIVGRQSRFVKLFGLRISLDQIEALLGQSGIVVHAVAVDDDLMLLLPDIAATDTARTLVANTYGVPKGAVHAALLAEVPLLPSGKTDMKTLAILAKTALQTPNLQGARQETLARVMAEATRHASVPLDESYTSLGGDSLGYLQVQIYLDRTLGAAPQAWENMTLRQLQELTVNQTYTTAFWSRLDMDVALRVAAIIMVILVHLGRLPVGGGTWLLVLLMGYSFARFQRPRLINGHSRDVLVRMLHPILLLYGLLLLAYNFVEDPVPLLYALLLGNAVPPGQGTILTVYWFVSLYAQIVIVLVGLFCFARFRHAQTQNPWLSSTVAFGVTTCIAIASLWLLPDPFPKDRYIGVLGSPVAIRSLEVCLPIAFLGMIIQSARGSFQNLIAFICVSITCVIFPATFISQPFILAAGGLLLIGFKTVPLPTIAARLVTAMAASTLYVYLLHNIIVHIVRTATPTLTVIGLPAAIAVVVPASFVVGHFAKRGFDALDRKILTWWRARNIPKVKAA